jgi:two-component system, NarL family, sensor histidine kinase UhpB
MRSRTLLSQVLAVNTVLVAITAFVAALIARDRLEDAASIEGLLLIALAVFVVVLLNSILLRRRLEPMGRLVDTMSSVDLMTPGKRADVSRGAEEVRRLSADFNRMLERLEHERRESGRAVLRAQEVERSRIAQDLHDEVNQALTGILLRLEATMSDAPVHLLPELEETKQLATQAMEELLHLARELRPTALDDHGLVHALASQIATFAERTGIRTTFQRPTGDFPKLSDEEQLVIYRVTQESLSNVVQHAGASRVDVELNFVGRTVLRVRDDGRGFLTVNGNGRNRLGVSGMRERALLVGGHLDIFSMPGEGTTIELTMGAT